MMSLSTMHRSSSISASLRESINAFADHLAMLLEGPGPADDLADDDQFLQIMRPSSPPRPRFLKAFYELVRQRLTCVFSTHTKFDGI